MDNKTVEVIIIEDNINVVHRTISTIRGDSNTFNVAINAIIEALTGNTVNSIPSASKQNNDKFAQAVPNYQQGQIATAKWPAQHVGEFHNEAQLVKTVETQFHPDLIKQGVAPIQATQAVSGAIPMVKLDMKTILKNGVKDGYSTNNN